MSHFISPLDWTMKRSSFLFSNGLLRDGNPIDAQLLIDTLGNNFSAKTRFVFEQTAPHLKSTLILGSPDFMMY